MYQPAAPAHPPPSQVTLPPGWTSHWSAEYQRAYYTNTQTGESSWNQPPPFAWSDPSHQTTQWKPKPTSFPQEVSLANPGYQNLPAIQQPQHQDHRHQYTSGLSLPAQVLYTPPFSPSPQLDNNGYFPSTIGKQASRPDQGGAQHQSYMVSPEFYNQRPDSTEPPKTSTPAATKYQQQDFPPPPVYSQTASRPESLSHSGAHLGAFQPQQSTGYGPTYYPPPPGQVVFDTASFSPPLTPMSTLPWQQSGSVQMASNRLPDHPTRSSQPQHPFNYTQPVTPYAHDQKQKASSSMMGKLGSKFGKLQNTIAPGSTASPLKKWGTRAALGIGAIGAVALGVDIADGGLFDGAAAAAGSGFDAPGADFGDASSAQTAIDANATQLALAHQGQENALMLLDPPGTTYTVVPDNSLI